MKLTTITENAVTKTPEEVMLAALAAIKVRGNYVKASEDESTKSDVLQTVWGIGVKAHDPSVAFMHSEMKDPTLAAQAKVICDWVRSYKLAPGDSDFLRNAQLMMNKPSVNERQIGFIVGCYPFYAKAVGTITKGGNSIQRTWPQEWGDVKMLWKQPVVVEQVSQQHSRTSGASYQRVTLILDAKYEFSWNISDDGTPPKKGQRFEITGYLEPSERGSIFFVPDRRWARAARKQLKVGDKADDKEDSGPGMD